MAGVEQTMKNYSIALLNFAMGTWLFLYGHETAAKTDVEKTSVSAGAKQEQAENNKAFGQKTDMPAMDTGSAAEAIVQKPLDLSIPFEVTVTESVGQKTEKNAAARDLFTAGKQRARTLELNGGAVMTQDPEGEKQQSVDGASIIFSVRP
jgi:hypothetical protein